MCQVAAGELAIVPAVTGWWRTEGPTPDTAKQIPLVRDHSSAEHPNRSSLWVKLLWPRRYLSTRHGLG